MKKFDYFTQLSLICLGLLCLLAKLSSVHLGWMPAATWIMLCLWQLASAAMLTLSKQHSSSVRQWVLTYWLIVACALGSHLMTKHLPQCQPLSLYAAFGIATLYYIWLTYKLAFYKRHKALW